MAIDRIQFEVTETASDEILRACRDYDEAQQRKRDNIRAFLDKHGTSKARPAHWGRGLATLIFPKESVPKGWRPARNQGADLDKGDVECVPDKRTAEGKQAASEMDHGAKEAGADTFRDPSLDPVLTAVGRSETKSGFGSGSVSDGRQLAWPRLLCLDTPDRRYVLDLPMIPGEGWTPPAGVVELRRSEFYQLVEAHNDGPKADKQNAA